MATSNKPAFSRVLDLPLAIAAVLTAGFYWFVWQESMKSTALHRYTTEHTVEYIIVAFFIWGLVDAVFRVLSFPRETLALRQQWLPARKTKESVSSAANWITYLERKPLWLQRSRLGRRLAQALGHVQEKGSADGFGDYLQVLSDQDHDDTQNNYGLIRFICWVTPMFGFLGTVVHFGTALGGQSAGEIGDKLPTIVAEMGTAFNTTTVALTAATTMMFCLFLCERTERGIVNAVDRRVQRELLNRFEVADANMAPFLAALEAASQSSLRSMDVLVERQIASWSGALTTHQQQTEKQQQWQAQLWVESLEKLEGRFENNDEKREQRLARLLESIEVHRKDHRREISAAAEQLADVKTGLTQLAADFSGLAHGESELVRLQSTLADNLRLLRETAQIDQALHGLTAAIHLLTARNQPAKESRAA